MNIGLKSAWASGLTATILGLGASLMSATPAAADVAVRCGAYGCDEIHCNYTGDRCYRLGNSTGYAYRARYSYGDGRYYRSGYRDYDRADYDDYGHYVCDSDGDRCYRSPSPYWNYREYYRRHGYHWVREEARYEPRYDYAPSDYRYTDREYRYTDRLNREEFDRARDDDFDWRR